MDTVTPTTIVYICQLILSVSQACLLGWALDLDQKHIIMMMHIAELPGGLSRIMATLCQAACKPIACSLLLEHLHSNSGFDPISPRGPWGKTSNPVLFPYLFWGDDNSFPTISQFL